MKCVICLAKKHRLLIQEAMVYGISYGIAFADSGQETLPEETFCDEHRVNALASMQKVIELLKEEES